MPENTLYRRYYQKMHKRNRGILFNLEIKMEQYYYNHMNKPQQAAYHSIFVGVKNLSDEIQVPALSGEELYNIFSR